jgi:hypothetical protein
MTPRPDLGDLTLLDAHQIRLRRGERNRIVLEVGGERRHDDVRVTHTFPVSRPGRYVLLRDADGGEIGLIADADALDRESRELLAEELDRAYFMPRILEVKSIEDQFGIATWHVVTDRGPTRFQVRARTESVWSLGGSRYLIKDVEGNRFDIRSLYDLDDRSRLLVEMQI